MASQTVPYITAEEYLEAERKAEYKSEYYDGQILAMSGGTRWHSLIGVNLLVELTTALKNRCEVHGSDMRLRVSVGNAYTYPDVTVICGKPEFTGKGQDILLNPTVIVEVLSKSTESYDRGPKFLLYRTIQSLQEYLLISQHERRVEICRRLNDKDWRIETIDSTSGRVRLASVDVELTFDRIYHGVTPAG